jgi:HEAT repeat protein
MSGRRKIEKLARQRGAEGLLELARDATSGDETRALVLEQLAMLADAGQLDESQRVESSSIARASVLAEDKYLRSWSLALLSIAHDGIAGHAALRAISDPEPLVRTSAAVALGKNDVVGRGEALMGLLEDPEWPVRQMAAVILMDVGEVRALPVLQQRLEREEDENARAAMRRAIAGLEQRSGS